MNSLTNFLPAISVFVIYALRMSELAAKRNVVRGPVHEKNTFRLFMLSGLIVLAGGLLEYSLRGMIWHWPLLAIGWVLAIASFAIRRAAIAALGRFWSLHNELRDNHEFVQSGPFRWVRHPTYFSMILELLAGILILNAPIAGCAAFLVFIPSLITRINFEEEALISKFGSEYENYIREIGMLIPNPFKRKRS